MPIWATNMRSDLVPVKIGSAGTARYGFSEVLPEEEDALLWLIIERILKNGHTAPDFLQASRWMTDRGLAPCHLVTPYDLVSEACGREVSRDEADEVMSKQGYLAEVAGGLRVIAANVPMSLVVAHPTMAGFYTRSDDRLGLMLTRTSSAWCIVPR
jgi:hypothetical protein